MGLRARAPLRLLRRARLATQADRGDGRLWWVTDLNNDEGNTVTSMNQRDTKLVQWLNEAHVKEAELEASLTAHIALTEKQAYKKRLQQHLKETREHKRSVASRIKKLGGSPQRGPGLPGAPAVVDEVAGKTVALVKGQLGAARAAVSRQAETHLRNLQEELREEHVEISIYRRLDAFATEVGDRDTSKLATAIVRDEERMAKYLDAELKRLVKAVVRAEVPVNQRANGKRSPSRKRATSASSRKRATTSSRKLAASASRKLATTAASRKRATSTSRRKRATSSSRPRVAGGSRARRLQGGARRPRASVRALQTSR
jgi:ferritin-like metal-binding protein YciE